MKNSEKPILDLINENSQESIRLAEESVNKEINENGAKFQEIISNLKENLEIYKSKLTKGLSSGESGLDKEIAVVKKDLAELTKNSNKSRNGTYQKFKQKSNMEHPAIFEINKHQK